MELAYYHHKLNVQVVEQDAKGFKGSLEIRKDKKVLVLALENLTKSVFCIKYFVKDCLRKQNSPFNSIQTP